MLKKGMQLWHPFCYKLSSNLSSKAKKFYPIRLKCVKFAEIYSKN
jgi:hypothetical protein